MNKFMLKVTNAVVLLMACGFIASPCFVWDRINASETKTKETYATKDEVKNQGKDIVDIKAQQKTDHDLLIEIRTIVKGDVR